MDVNNAADLAKKGFSMLGASLAMSLETCVKFASSSSAESPDDKAYDDRADHLGPQLRYGNQGFGSYAGDILVESEYGEED